MKRLLVSERSHINSVVLKGYNYCINTCNCNIQRIQLSYERYSTVTLGNRLTGNRAPKKSLIFHGSKAWLGMNIQTLYNLIWSSTAAHGNRLNVTTQFQYKVRKLIRTVISVSQRQTVPGTIATVLEHDNSETEQKNGLTVRCLRYCVARRGTQREVLPGSLDPALPKIGLDSPPVRIRLIRPGLRLVLLFLCALPCASYLLWLVVANV